MRKPAAKIVSAKTKATAVPEKGKDVLRHPILSDPALTNLRVLTTPEAAEVLGVSVPTLERWRRVGAGPAWIKLGLRRVGYPVGGLKDHTGAAA